MMLSIFIVVALSTPFAAAYECFDSAKYIASIHHIHEECRDVVQKVVQDRSDCGFAYVIWGMCHYRASKINNKYQQIDHTKFVELLKSFSSNPNKEALAVRLSVCEKEGLIHGGDFTPYFDCLQLRCPEVGNIRVDFDNAAHGICA